MISHLTFSGKLDALHFDFTSGDAMAGSNGYYRSEVGIVSAAWIIQGGWMVPGKTEYQNFKQGELGVQLRVMCAITIMESI